MITMSSVGIRATVVRYKLLIDNVVDLGVTIDNKLKFSDHINRIECKAHKHANLIIRCFMSRDLSSLVEPATDEPGCPAVLPGRAIRLSFVTPGQPGRAEYVVFILNCIT